MLTRRDMLKWLGVAAAPLLMNEEWLNAAPEDHELVPLTTGPDCKKFACVCHGRGSQEIVLSKIPNGAKCPDYILSNESNEPLRFHLKIGGISREHVATPWIRWYMDELCGPIPVDGTTTVSVKQKKPSNWAASLIIYV